MMQTKESAPAIHQFLAGFTNGDAISNEALIMREIFRSWGRSSDIFCESMRILPELRGQARDIAECRAACKPADIALLHLSIGSPINEVFASISCRKALLYHNITPPRFFDLINKRTAENLRKGIAQTRSLANAAQVNMADSKFNADELVEFGYRDVKVLPVLSDINKPLIASDGTTLRRYDDGKVNVLFVGRCAPNKKIEDALLAFYHFHKSVARNSRFIHVGSYAGTERYYYLLLSLARELGLNSVHFAGAVPREKLNAFYRCADIFLGMAEHEGFCVPVIESMAHDVPVMAYGAAAVPETMDGAGIVFKEKRWDQIAEMMGRLVHDAYFRDAVIKGQRQRLERYTQRDLASELRQHLAPLLE